MPRRLRWLLAVVPLLLAGVADAVVLQPVLSGLTNPLYLTHARDGSGRLFIVEQAGIIKVLQPGASVPTPFLDIRDRVLSGGERGLLGLAFHPQYPSNGRFFVNYTRQGDGATVIAEYRVSSNPNVAQSTETPLLTIDRPAANHNGGMIEFGPDGFLYIGTGDSGSSNDPLNYAQNRGVLQGKILRIDVSGGTLPYGIPLDNPFVGVPGTRAEIWAFGLRNPFRFSFDRATGTLIVGDVGQNQFEEIDVVTRGANMGWRVFEGFQCTGNDPGLCGILTSTLPIAAYAHDGRCSVTGGYVYRGQAGALAQGTYVFGDFCSGEIFTLNVPGVALILDTTLQISSFGEDEAGEIYVVGLGGTVHRLAAPAVSPSFVGAVLPSSRSVMVDTPATAFATMINASNAGATGCRLTLATPLPATFGFQTTDPATNAPTGVANEPVDIAPQASQSFVFFITPTAPIPPTVVQIDFQCDGGAAQVFPGVSTLEFSAALGPVPDLVALTAVLPQSGGVLDLDPVTGAGVFGVASINVGVRDLISVTPDTG
ncbi:MAG: PQQ-dependent sugar dehydrogenase, partial [Candidatus Rokuibacteriota bacterium]